MVLSWLEIFSLGKVVTNPTVITNMYIPMIVKIKIEKKHLLFLKMKWNFWESVCSIAMEHVWYVSHAIHR